MVRAPPLSIPRGYGSDSAGGANLEKIRLILVACRKLHLDGSQRRPAFGVRVVDGVVGAVVPRTEHALPNRRLLLLRHRVPASCSQRQQAEADATSGSRGSRAAV